jgi:serine protease
MPASAQTRLIPLFAAYSSNRLDYFYSSAPQQMSAAYRGTLQPIGSSALDTGGAPLNSDYSVRVGGSVAGYASAFPGLQMFELTPSAEVWIFSTPENPKSATPLTPIYRLSFACNHQLYPVAAQPAICATKPTHVDTLLTEGGAILTGPTGLLSIGYRIDGIEGYVYPKTLAQPLGTTKLLRRYNASRDDHAIFPETKLVQYQNEGYTSGTAWLGYVYENNGTSVPIIQ